MPVGSLVLNPAAQLDYNIVITYIVVGSVQDPMIVAG